jgi:cytochrome oxidase Cu insertion factor (SCO1/SenC/PrrC family)
MNRSVLLAILVGLASPILMPAQGKPYPKPQVESSAGNPVADFTLNDQDGKPFKLSQQRGKWVVLYFYRGYW